MARSSAEAEFRAMANEVCKLLWIQRVLRDSRKEISLPMKLFSDNKAAISIAQNPVQQGRNIKVDPHFSKEKLGAGLFVHLFYQLPDS